MRKCCVFLLIFTIFLAGCSAEVQTSVPVSIVEGEGVTVENNGLWVEPGEDAVFLLDVPQGYTVGSTDYQGMYQVGMSNGKTILTLKEIRYPTTVRIGLTEDFAAITFHPNGGDGDAVTELYDRSIHTRPNTATELFTRDGYTLTGWNTAPDGSGIRIGLGSRADADNRGITLYAQWEKWNDASDFRWSEGAGITITGFYGSGESVVIPETINGKPVTGIAHRAFVNCSAKQVVLPRTMERVAVGAFENCALESVVLFDSILEIRNDSFRNCPDFRTVYINVAEPPFGYGYRKESVYADKMDLLIGAAGKRKLVCYGGCSMWYNLDGRMLEEALNGEYTVINLGLNGLANSAVQMQIMLPYLEEGDILFHTPELASATQMMRRLSMNEKDDVFWCGVENNYDLITGVDVQSVPGLLDSFCTYLERKNGTAAYSDVYRDSHGRMYLDQWGGIPFERTETAQMLSDPVSLAPDCIDAGAMDVLAEYYGHFLEQGVRVYVGYACVNLDAVPEEERENAELMDSLFQKAVEKTDGPVLISGLSDYLYRNEDFYDTNYHLLSENARENTARWIRDIKQQMTADGLEVAP